MPGAEVARVVNRCNEAKECNHLDLSDCEMTAMPAAVFLLMKGTVLQSCTLADNLLKKMTSKFPRTFSSLTALNLSHNNYTELPDNLAQITGLIDLDLSHNKFEAVPDPVYQLEKLKKLNVSDNNIKDAEAQGIKSLSCIQEVNFKNNPLSFETYSALLTISEGIIFHLSSQDPVLDGVD